MTIYGNCRTMGILPEIQLKNFENCSCGSNDIAVPKAEKASELWLSLLQISALRNQLYFIVGSIASAVLRAGRASSYRFNFSQAIGFPYPAGYRCWIEFNPSCICG